MIGTLILTHGGLARELLASAKKIAGELSDFEALSLDWDAPPEVLQEQIRQSIQRLDHGDGVLVLVDVFGGTPCNAALSYLRQANGSGPEVEVVTGVNLPMVLRLGCLTNKDMSLQHAAEWLSGKGQGSICIAKPSDDGCASMKNPCE